MIKVGTDCSGVGAPEEALKSLGIEHEVEFASDIDPAAKKTFEANHKTKIFYNSIEERGNISAPYVDLYIAGFPCQAFSIAGHRLGFEDIRGTVFFNCAEYIKYHKPGAFILENVRGLLSHDKPKGSKQKFGRTFSTILNVLGSTVNGQTQFQFYEDNLGYHIYWTVLNTRDFGIPQNRERVFIVGIRPDIDTGYSFPNGFKLEKTLYDILEPQVDKKYFIPDYTLQKMFLRHPNFTPKVNPDISGTLTLRNNSNDMGCDAGTNLIVVNDNGTLVPRDVFTCLDANYWKGMDNHQQRSFIMSDGKALVLSGVKAGFEVATDGDSINLQYPSSTTRKGRVGKQISQTLDTGNHMGILIGKTVRRLTPRECFRLQGFPDSFKFVVSETQLYKQAGNSMSVPVIAAVIKNLKNILGFGL